MGCLTLLDLFHKSWWEWEHRTFSRGTCKVLVQTLTFNVCQQDFFTASGSSWWWILQLLPWPVVVTCFSAYEEMFDKSTRQNLGFSQLKDTLSLDFRQDACLYTILPLSIWIWKMFNCSLTQVDNQPITRLELHAFWPVGRWLADVEASEVQAVYLFTL